MAADSRLLDEESIASLKMPAYNDIDLRSRTDKFSVDDTVSVSREGRLVIVEGTFPTGELRGIDLGVP